MIFISVVDSVCDTIKSHASSAQTERRGEVTRPVSFLTSRLGLTGRFRWLELWFRGQQVGVPLIAWSVHFEGANDLAAVIDGVGLFECSLATVLVGRLTDVFEGLVLAVSCPVLEQVVKEPVETGTARQRIGIVVSAN